jgi:hypothetical protein
MNYLYNAASSIYGYLVINPLRKIYLFGPAVFGFGFWQGLPAPEICSHITNYSETFWRDNYPDCKALIDAKFYSFQITIEAFLYFLLLYKSLQLVTNCVCKFIRQKAFDRTRSSSLCHLSPGTIVVYQKSP